METIKNLLQIKRLIALILTIVFSILALRGQIGATEFLTIFSMVMSLYFGQGSSRQVVKESKKQ